VELLIESADLVELILSLDPAESNQSADLVELILAFLLKLLNDLLEFFVEFELVTEFNEG
jgi:hypothetical protein